MKYLSSPKLRMVAFQKALLVRRVGRQATDFEKIFTNHIANKELLPQTVKELSKTQY